jgi:hypothetical protein
MKKALSIAAAGAAVVLAAGIATSSSAATNFQGIVAVDGYDSVSGGLQIDINNIIPNFSTGNLTVGHSTGPIELFGIYTDEQVNVNPGGLPGDGDATHQNIFVNFTFTNPNLPGSGPDGTVGGETYGVGVAGFVDHGHVHWTGPTTVDFAGIGALTITLSDADFGQFVNNEGFVNGTFSLGTIPTAGVPEPASWALMIGGFGMTGAMMRRRRTAVAATA